MENGSNFSPGPPASVCGPGRRAIFGTYAAFAEMVIPELTMGADQGSRRYSAISAIPAGTVNDHRRQTNLPHL